MSCSGGVVVILVGVAPVENVDLEEGACLGMI
jgi:hypothetical protein